MGKVINAIKKLYLSGYKRLFPLKYARHIGVNIAGDAEILGDIGWSTEPYLIHVGSKTRITNEVAFVTHDGAIVNVRRAGLSEKYKNVVKFGEIHVGDNCFIGTRSTILPDVTIGNNSIVGACSLVTKDIPPNEVWGGFRQGRYVHSKSMQKNCMRLLQNMNLLLLRIWKEPRELLSR